AEVEPDRKEVPEKRTEGRCDGSVFAEQGGGQQDRDGAREHVAYECRGGESLAAGAKNVRGADIAGADGADIGAAGEPRQQEPERDRAAQIAEGEGCRVGERRRPVERL